MYIIVDGELHGTGLRDYYNGGYISPEHLNLSDFFQKRLSKWLLDYEAEHYNQFRNETEVEKLDKEGLEIALMLKKELENNKIGYYSAAKLKTLLI